jgi:hypothetical protein
MTEAELEEAIAGITEVLKGQLTNFERACHSADRRELREKLTAARNAAEKAQ